MAASTILDFQVVYIWNIPSCQ